MCKDKATLCRTACKKVTVNHCVGVVSSWCVLFRCSKHKVFKYVCNIVQLRQFWWAVLCTISCFAICTVSLQCKGRFSVITFSCFLCFCSFFFGLDLKWKKNHWNWFLPFGWLSGASRVSSHCFSAVVMSCMFALVVEKKKLKLKMFCALFFFFYYFWFTF